MCEKECGGKHDDREARISVRMNVHFKNESNLLVFVQFPNIRMLINCFLRTFFVISCRWSN